jgi:hypothetical protein
MRAGEKFFHANSFLRDGWILLDHISLNYPSEHIHETKDDQGEFDDRGYLCDLGPWIGRGLKKDDEKRSIFKPIKKCGNPLPPG